MEITSIVGLVPPKEDPPAHLFDWTVDGVRRPHYLRWSWHPVTGELLVGAIQRHNVQIPKGDPLRCFESWLRGFYFVRERLIAIRPYWWPLTPYDDPDDALDKRVTDAAVKLLIRNVPEARFQTGVDNRWLSQNFSKYAVSW